MAITPNIAIRQQCCYLSSELPPESCISMSRVNGDSRQTLWIASGCQPKLKDETNRPKPIPLAFPWGQLPLYSGDQNRANRLVSTPMVAWIDTSLWPSEPCAGLCSRMDTADVHLAGGPMTTLGSRNFSVAGSLARALNYHGNGRNVCYAWLPRGTREQKPDSRTRPTQQEVSPMRTEPIPDLPFWHIPHNDHQLAFCRLDTGLRR